MREKTLEEVLGDFTPTPREPIAHVKNGTTLTIWVSSELKARYNHLQIKSGRRFSKKAREAILALIELAELRIAVE